MRGITIFVATVLALGLSLDALSGPVPPSVRDAVTGQLPGSTMKITIVFPSESAAQLFVLSGERVEAHSVPFEFFPEASYGATWVDQIEVRAPDAFVLRFRVRKTCGPGVYDYRFAKRAETWYVSGLDRKESRCSDAGVADAWEKSYNFLNGRTRFIDYANGHPKKGMNAGRVFPSFRLADFEALHPKYEP